MNTIAELAPARWRFETYLGWQFTGGVLRGETTGRLYWYVSLGPFTFGYW